MAVEVITWVFARSCSRNGQRLVMLAVADACNSPDGTGAWLSNAALRAKTGLSERAVQVAVRECEGLGELKVDRGQGRGGVNRFEVIMGARRGAESAGFTEEVQNLRGAESAVDQTDEGSQVKPEKGAESAGQRRRQKGAGSAPGTVGTSTSSGSTREGREKTARGTRLPADFHATPEMIDWARKNTPNVGVKETEAFIDHFSSAPGQKGVKVNWVAAWRNWMRREQKTFDREQRYAERRNGSAASQRSSSQAIPPDQQCPRHRGQPGGTRGDGRPKCGQCRAETAGRRTP